jgi:aminoglycoside 6'-N-acetyltransferase I
MDIEIIHVTSANASVLAHTDAEVFDAAINPAQLAAFLDSNLHLLVIARTPALVVGQLRAMIHLQPDGPSQLYIDNLGVAPDYRRKGIARALVREAFLWGQSHDCADAWVATETDNLAARALYDTFKSAPDETVVYYPLNISALG